MIKLAFLKAQTTKATQEGKTTPFLRRLILGAVDHVARTHYSDSYPLRCMQTSAAIQMLLGRTGIRSELWMGATCFSEVFHDSARGGWGGFWGDDHHIWLHTQFGECVDLNITQLHLHPSRRRKDGFAPPAIWWDDRRGWPSVITYLPDSCIRVGFETPEDEADLKSFLERVTAHFDATLLEKKLNDITFGPILASIESMNALHVAHHPWVVRSVIFQERDIPFPLWIQDRLAEILAFRQRGERAPSRLRRVPGLTGQLT